MHEKEELSKFLTYSAGERTQEKGCWRRGVLEGRQE